MAVTLCGPLASGPTVHDHEPVAVAVVLQSVALVASVRTTTVFGVAVPLMVGVNVATTLPGTGSLIVTLGGAATVKVLTTGVDRTPARLVAIAVTLCTPLVNVRLSQAYVPDADTVTMHGPPVDPGPPITVTLLPGVAVPEIGGFFTVTSSSEGLRMVSVGGTVTVKFVTLGSLTSPSL